ncbi:MAG TPA: dTMP kinase [Patescibacteria group bacterium]|nr:dTMP kinase [Patescibacteria group bacterium]
MNGKFIVIEGQGFTGKTTQANLLIRKLQDSGIEAISVRHPGGTEHAEKYRQQLLEKKQAGVLTPDEELELILKALHSLVNDLILPALEKGTWVVLTRFIASTIIYQGYQEGLDKDFIKIQAEKASQHLKTDLSILIDLPEEEIMNRQAKAHDSEIHAYNNSDSEILRIRRNGFLEVFENMDTSVILDGSKSKEEISEEIWKKISASFNLTT